MKKMIFLFFAVIAFSLPAFSFKQIVVQFGNEVTLYDVSQLQLALDSAKSGSDVYLPGYDFGINNNVTIKKKLNIFGTGVYSNATSITGQTKLGNVYCRKFSDSTTFEGIIIDDFYTEIQNTDSVSNIKFKKCKITYTTIGTAVAKFIDFKDCIFTADQTIKSLAKNISFRNCLFFPYNNNSFGNWVFRSCYNTSLQHCAIFGERLFAQDGNSTNNLFQDCIFYSILSIESWTGTGNMFENCLSVFNLPTWGANNTALNCLVNKAQSTIFVNVPNSSMVFDETHDYHLKVTCAGHNYGTDGTDLGVYGTTNPFKDKLIPVIPYIKANSTATKTVNGKLDINIDVESQTK